MTSQSEPRPAIALFHSVLGVRPGVELAADRFQAAGYRTQVVDQYAGRVFDDYAEAGEFAESIGYWELMRSAVDAVASTPGPLVVAGFSNGGGMAEFTAATRNGTAGGVIGLLNFSGALPLSVMGVMSWPEVPVQLHYAEADPFRNPAWVAEFLEAVLASGALLESYLDYPGSGHLFTDPSLPAEYDAGQAELLFDRALDFLNRL